MTLLAWAFSIKQSTFNRLSKAGICSTQLIDSLKNKTVDLEFIDKCRSDGHTSVYIAAQIAASQLENRSKTPKIKHQKSKAYWDNYRQKFNQLLADNPHMKSSTAS